MADFKVTHQRGYFYRGNLLAEGTTFNDDDATPKERSQLRRDASGPTPMLSGTSHD
jgi:hypothetical protein